MAALGKDHSMTGPNSSGSCYLTKTQDCCYLQQSRPERDTVLKC